MDTPTAVPADIETVQQREESVIAVSVKHDGPITTQALPARNAAMENWTIQTVAANTELHRIQGDRRRRRVILMATDKPFMIGESRAKVTSGRGAVWPVGVPCELLHVDDVYVACFSVTPADTTSLNVIEEFWAD